MSKRYHLKKDHIQTSLDPQEILRTPLLNKGTGFTKKEREELGLDGLLPSHISSIEEQVERRYANFKDKDSEIGKYMLLRGLQDRNEVLFYRLALEYSEQMLPYIYTPTVGDASLNFSKLYNQNRGIYISYPLKDKMLQLVQNIPRKDVDVIVVTDGSRILGLGDLGVGGMSIPVGKLSLYTLFGGVYPGRTLPILLDAGTDNQELLDDPLYLGWRHPRIKEQPYYEFVEEFVQAIKKSYPGVLLQWEDFCKPHAGVLLTKYRDSVCSFNDDIQGTASVALSAILAAVKSKNETLDNQKVCIVGAGGAGIGIATILHKFLCLQGMDEKTAYEKFYMVDRYGLIVSGQEHIDSYQKNFAKKPDITKSWGLPEGKSILLHSVIEKAEPTIVIGVSAQHGLFDESLVKTLCKNCPAPIIFPLSNPPSKAEATPEDLVKWSDGRAIIATGSPPKTIKHSNGIRHISQCNNVYIFPGLGLGVIASKSRIVTDEMFLIAADTLSNNSPILKDPKAPLFPSIGGLRKVSKMIGIEVAKYAIRQGLSEYQDEALAEKLIEDYIWDPNYTEIRRG